MQLINAQLQIRDGAKTIAETEACVSSEQELMRGARDVNDGGKRHAAGGIETARAAAASGVT